ncbi:MAG: hypothetical protein ABS75_25935 [Pelagibacterium sp. SCN 63-23]|nr:MAG: hypothetical protein ABS75_25935 [Pelagibacterium sp. SCN 63-23]
MHQEDSDKLLRAESLARIYIDTLAIAEGVSTNIMKRQDDQVIDLLADLATGAISDAPRLRVDLVLAAILLGRAVAGEQSLASRLRQGQDAVLVIETHSQEWVDLIEDVVERCAIQKATTRKTVVARDGTERSHSPDRGNDTILKGLTHGWPVIGIAPDPKRHLPSSLLRTAEYHLALAPIDGWAVRLLLEAITGDQFAGEIDEAIVRASDISDFCLSFRSDYSAERCLARLAELVTNKRKFTSDGPTLEELHGYGEAADWGLELSADLKDYRAGRLQWDEIANRSLLLSGPPGVGKTSFAKALAKSAGIHLVSTSVADWNAASYLSGTLQAIRSAFAEAKKHAPSVLFIDEFDGISSRENLTGDYVEYWSQIINMLLECMSGAADQEGVILVAATNHPGRIDRAILRAGRIDHHIALEKPGVDDLAQILRFHLGPDTLIEADLMPAALAARGATGADAEAWVRRAKATARRSRRALSMTDLLTQIRGRVSDLPPETRWRVAVHEAGHIIAARTLEIGRVVGVSIASEGGSVELASTPGEDTDEALIDKSIAFLLAGRAAEILVLGSPGVGSGGARSDSDLARATELAKMAETVFGYGVLGLVHVTTTNIAEVVRYPGLLPAMRERLDRGLTRARDLLTHHRGELDNLAKALNLRGYLSADDVEAISQVPGSGGTKAARRHRVDQDKKKAA